MQVDKITNVSVTALFVIAISFIIPIWASIIIAILAGLYDNIGGYGSDWFDMVYYIIGAAIGAIVVLSIL